jgi:hypothetical protein
MGKEVGVLKGPVAKRVGGEGRRRRQREGKVWAWMSKSKGGDREDGAARALSSGIISLDTL